MTSQESGVGAPAQTKPAQPNPAQTNPAQTDPAQSVSEPLLTVAKGNPTPEELAAVTAVVLALGSGAAAEGKVAPGRQFARRAQLHLPPRPGAGAWRRSGR